MFNYESVIINGQTGAVTSGYPFEFIHNFDTAKIETYSVSIDFFTTFLDSTGFKKVEVIFGDRSMPNFSDIALGKNMIRMASNSVDAGKSMPSWLANLVVDHEKEIINLISNGNQFYVSKTPSHKKLFLLERNGCDRRAIIGSVNASISSVCGAKEEALVYWDGGDTCDALFSYFDQRKSSATLLDAFDITAWVKLRHA